MADRPGQVQPYHPAEGDVIECPSCQSLNADDSRYCRICGHKMSPAAFEAAPTSVPAVSSSGRDFGTSPAEGRKFLTSINPAPPANPNDDGWYGDLSEAERIRDQLQEELDEARAEAEFLRKRLGDTDPMDRSLSPAERNTYTSLLQAEQKFAEIYTAWQGANARALRLLSTYDEIKAEGDRVGRTGAVLDTDWERSEFRTR
jgi:hypothetical protein